ncbi:MAG: hypothetical protein LBI95_03985 [Holosporales bacterium]|jgi:DNA polymerase-1|nr:hypothetical protein [Holosporales bacterium]
MINLIDVSGFIYRAFYALPSLTHNRMEVGALYGFCSAMTKIISEFPKSMFIAALDCGKKTFRNDIYKEYKANRKAMPTQLLDQIPFIKEACKRFGFFIAEKSGFEADDVIATYVKKGREHKINIISADKDLVQLLGKNVTIYNPVKQEYVTEDDVLKKFGVTSDKVLDVLSLTGDTSDNIPGVPGIGAKTAAALINEFGSLDNLISNLNHLPNNKKNEILKNEIDKAILAKKLISLKDDLEMSFEYEVSVPNGISDFLTDFGFTSLVKPKQKQFF